ncbi:MAG: tRNA guanosine(34) transglycosylase Tgt [Planctomycetota bacterium]
MPPLSFDILARSGQTAGRTGTVTTPHGSFETPAFMTVGTKATVKGLTPGMVADCGAQIVLNNTYHLMMRPGPEVVRDLGGSHRVMNWHGPILTDSGGFQAYSMADASRLSDDGVVFRHEVSGDRVTLGPELSMKVQNDLGADIIMAMDDCPPAEDPLAAPANLHRPKIAQARLSDYSHERRLDEANDRTVQWLERCVAAHARPEDQALFGIVQGGTDLDRRRASVERVCSFDLPGFAIGGVAVGESTEDIHRIVRATAPLLPGSKPRYLMGVGYPADLVAASLAGVDMFDCVLPTRNGRNANAFVPGGQIRLKNARFERDPLPIEPGCDCPACDPARYPWASHMCPDGACFSRGTIRHYFRADEMLGPILVSLHNLRQYQRLMADIRTTIRTDAWADFAKKWPSAAAGLPAEVLA